ncbi:hypothetical protein BSPWISOXPB_4978 [uncultured Gammaproteobacteria bacterium]|nr:hypothetical protein BSPWISOXPB_4978 [uncultured Gammaproteobacteria bacterium]
MPPIPNTKAFRWLNIKSRVKGFFKCVHLVLFWVDFITKISIIALNNPIEEVKFHF